MDDKLFNWECGEPNFLRDAMVKFLDWILEEKNMRKCCVWGSEWTSWKAL